MIRLPELEYSQTFRTSCRTEQEFQTFEVLKIPISVVTLDTAASSLVRWAEDSVGRYVGVREVASVMAMQSSSRLLNVAKHAAMNLPDGMPIVWLGKSKGYQVERTCGPDLMLKVMLEHRANGLRHFFYGGKPGVAEELANRFQKLAPGVQIVGTYCPPFRPLTDEEDAEVCALICRSGADVVWVGISSPAQDLWMFEHYNRLPQTLVGVGAAFDFHSGAIARAPRWMQRVGLEWLSRLCQEPRRLWRRYLVLGPIFIFKVLCQGGR